MIDEGLKKGFWQVCFYDDEDYKDKFENRYDYDYRKLHLVKVASKLNELALSKFPEKNLGFTFTEIAAVQKQENRFFKSIRDRQSESYKKINASFYTISGNSLGVAYRFANETHPIRNNFLIYPLGIQSERDETILQKAIQLECSAEAVNQLILYRGSEFVEDTLTKKQQGRFSSQLTLHANSLSYGTSLYGGALYDGGATAINYMRQSSLDAQAYLVPLKEQLECQTPFHIPLVHPIISLGSKGEVFHARSKLWKMDDNEKVLGFLGTARFNFSEVDPLCKTNETKIKVEEAFTYYKNKAYILAKKV